jgi:hypothetical protein
MLDRREFVVQLVVTSTHEFVIEARSESEAVQHAEGMIEDGDYGTILDREVEMADAFASEDVEDDEESEDEDED